jgi:hypothetical protein
MSSQIVQQRQENEQLRREAAMKRIPVSQAVEDIKVHHPFRETGEADYEATCLKYFEKKIAQTIFSPKLIPIFQKKYLCYFRKFSNAAQSKPLP